MFKIRRIRPVNVILVLVVALFLVGCSSSKLDPLESGDVIVAFGDSLTFGVGARSENSYPSVLAGLSGFEVVNAGISGETTGEGLKRLPQVLDEYSPSLLILLEGGNDILRNKPYDQIERNLDSMISEAKSRGVQVVLIGVPEKKLFSSSAPFYKRLAEKHDLVFESKLVGGLMRSPSKKSDTVHFNKAGYAHMAEAINDLLLENGAFN